MRISLANLLLATSIIALTVALVVSRQREPNVLIGDISNTWELQRAIAKKSEWHDKKIPPDLTNVDAYRIGQSVCDHLENSRDATSVGNWQLVAIIFERMDALGEDNWAYVIQVEGTDYPEHAGQSIVQRVQLLVLLDGTIIFDSGSPENGIAATLANFPGIVDARPSIDERLIGNGGLF